MLPSLGYLSGHSCALSALFFSLGAVLFSSLRSCACARVLSHFLAFNCEMRAMLYCCNLLEECCMVMVCCLDPIVATIDSSRTTVSMNPEIS